MKYSILSALLIIPILGTIGCTNDQPPPPPADETTFEDITRDPRLVNRVAGCWFDNETLVYTPEGVQNMCAVRADGDEIACSEMCEDSAFNVWNMCGSVSKCKALFWVESENPLEKERGCWRCVDACFDSLDRTPEAFDACRPVDPTPPEVPMEEL